MIVFPEDDEEFGEEKVVLRVRCNLVFELLQIRTEQMVELFSPLRFYPIVS